ncbi:MAG: LysM peptidoglycan-binding domain-containing protein [Caldilineae bacterium]|nr:MAG: LysM peptidoglycan-binding domain-containing protein [Caldilineae bacterium]
MFSLQRLFPRLAVVLLAVVLFQLAPVADVAADGPGTRTHVVQPGDTLLAIATRYGVSVEAIMKANNLADPNLIYAGQRLLIPLPNAGPDAQQPLTLYQVRPGDTWPQVAYRLGTTPERLLALNGLNSPKYLFLFPEIYAPAPPPVWPRPFLRIEHTPVIIQGQTGVLYVTLARSRPPKATFAGTTLRFVLLEHHGNAYRYQAFLPTGALLPPGDHALTLQAGKTRLSLDIPVRAGDYITQTIRLPAEKSSLLEPTLVQAELKRLQAIWSKHSGSRLWREPFVFPIGPGFQRTSPFGTRRSYDGGPVSSYHAGTDWSAPEGTAIQAPAPGVVVLAEPLTVRGGAVIIDHGQGVFSNFWHLSEIRVQVGDRVQQGEVVGLVGTTGLSTGAHLHWELRVYGVAVDPMQWTERYFPFLPTVSARQKKTGP